MQLSTGRHWGARARGEQQSIASACICARTFVCLHMYAGETHICDACRMYVNSPLTRPPFLSAGASLCWSPKLIFPDLLSPKKNLTWKDAKMASCCRYDRQYTLHALASNRFHRKRSRSDGCGQQQICGRAHDGQQRSTPQGAACKCVPDWCTTVAIRRDCNTLCRKKCMRAAPEHFEHISMGLAHRMRQRFASFLGCKG